MSALPSVTSLPGTYPGAADVPQFTAADDAATWVIDFHAPRGLTPLGLSVFAGVVRASQEAAAALSMPGTRGLAGRVAGSHVYVSALGAEGGTAGTVTLDDPAAAWARAAGALDAEQRALRGRTVTSARDARRLLADAFAAAERAWRVHFDFMYPLLAAYLEFFDRARELGVPADVVPRLMQGYPTRITETDRAIWDLAAGEGDLDAFLERHGWRTEGIYEPALVPWVDDPGPVHARVRLVRGETERRSFADVEAASVAAREAAEREALASLRRDERDEFLRALDAARVANFAWWNEDHNAVIDLCAHIPVRRAALAVGERAGLAAPDDALYLFRAELEQLADGDRAPADVQERRALHAQWAARRDAFPQLAGRAPERIDDPVLREIFGLGEGISGAGAPAELRGIPASAGVARGRARVLRESRELASLRPAEVIVCEATTPSWTPAFAAAAACVCDHGGSLTHAAIVSREYGLPCVTGTLRATQLIATGDLVEVDGGEGRVRVLERAA